VRFIRTSQEVRHVFQLWDVVLAVAAFSLEDFEHVAIFATSVRRVQTGQIAIHRPPENNNSTRPTL